MAEITRKVVDKKGKCSTETVLYLSSLSPEALTPQSFLTITRSYWGIEAGLHHRLDISAREDHSRIRNRNSLLAIGMVRRTIMGFYFCWRQRQQPARRTTLTDFHDAMRDHNRALAWHLLNGHSP